MRRRSFLVVLAALAGALAVLRRRRAATRVDVYYEDGSMVTLEPTLPQAERMLAASGRALAVARTGA